MAESSEETKTAERKAANPEGWDDCVRAISGRSGSGPTVRPAQLSAAPIRQGRTPAGDQGQGDQGQTAVKSKVWQTRSPSWNVVPWEVQPKAVVVVGVLLPDGLASYGQPARGAGASVVSSRPEGGPVNMFSGPLHC